MINEEDDLIPCSECNGEGVVYEDVGTDEYKIGSICPKCHGHKKLDWIENILGKNNSRLIDASFTIDETDIFYVKDINPIKFSKKGVKIWGQKILKK